MEYVKIQMIRMVNNDATLQTIYLALVKQIGIDPALQQLYHERVEKGVQYYRDMYAKFADEKKHDDTVEASKSIELTHPVSIEVDRLIKLYGWRDFLQGLQDFADKKVTTMRRCGMPSRADQWIKIRDQFSAVIKTPML